MTSTNSASPSRAPLAPQYAPAEVEGRLYRSWVDAGYFRPEHGAPAEGPDTRPAYAIVIPPPNVTGSLHLGHAFQHTLMDALTRRRRMQGHAALWLPGMDHAGIATQTLVERHLFETEHKRRQDYGRDEFVDRVWAWKEEYGGRILGQMRRFGCGVDWSRERFTMDEGLSRAVQTIFKRLFDDRLVYRAERLVNWSPGLQSAISDIEVEYKDVEGEMVSIRYGGGPGEPEIVVATTRAETMLGDTAVAVHPDDLRYRDLIGKTVELPLTGRRIPIIADSYVDPEFGTGAVKITPAHDPNDFEVGKRHGLAMLTILDERGVVTAPGPFEGLDRFEARPAIVAALREEGRIVKEVRPYTHSVGHCSRTGVPVEPRLSTQWFVEVAPLAKAAGDAVRDGRVAISPADMSQRYFDWVDNMHDWCISRQLWWGHRIPVWYGPEGEVVCVGPDDEPPAGEGWVQDPDVLDTWFSSALWPFSTLGWPERTADLERFYPTDVLLTGYDIIFFWVARMMMFGLYAMGHPDDQAAAGRDAAAQVPFRTIALTGLVRDQHGRKMSKSRGNTVDPLEWMDAYGADALRLTLARGANPGADVPIGEEWVAGSRNFCNKVWNATRFALISGATVSEPLPPWDRMGVADRWILSRLARLIEDVDRGYEAFEFARVADALWHFTRDELCDWYLELVKVPLAAGGEAAQASRVVLGHVLDGVLRMLHPIIPFVTDELWTTLTGGDSLVVAPWPTADPTWLDPTAEAEIAQVQQVVGEIRSFRSDQGLRPTAKVAAALDAPADSAVARHEAEIRAITRLTAPERPLVAGEAGTARLHTGDVTVLIDLAGTVDVAAERARLGKALDVAAKELAAVRGKLGNAAFLAKAPEPVVAKIRAREAAALADVARLEALRDALPVA